LKRKLAKGGKKKNMEGTRQKKMTTDRKTTRKAAGRGTSPQSKSNPTNQTLVIIPLIWRGCTAAEKASVISDKEKEINTQSPWQV